jgi:Right handed beta helix region/FlgD Ig-like domain
MRCTVLLLPLLIAIPNLTQAATYTVANTNDSGPGSLRQAILDANASVGADVITFAPAMSGQTVRPTSPLDAVTDAQTTIDGDLNDDNAPDIALSGTLQGTGEGLLVQGQQCTIEGLAIVRFPSYGVHVSGADSCRIRNCHLGVTLGGNTAAANGYGDVRLYQADGCIVGEPGKRNVIAANTGSYSGGPGVTIVDGQSNTIQSNYFGLNRAGTATLGTDSTGVSIYSTSVDAAKANTVRNNVFAALYYGVYVEASGANVIQGNLFGLAANGTTAFPMAGDGVRLQGECMDNQVGGTTAAARNVFVGTDSAYGIEIGGAGNHDNRVRGNFFGLDVTGTTRMSLGTGVQIGDSAGDQLVGGPAAAAGNYFASSNDSTTYGVFCHYGGTGTAIQRNRFGVLPVGGAAARANGTHIRVTQASGVSILDNVVASAPLGINIDDSGNPRPISVFGNTFRACGYAVQLLGAAQARLGNLGNASTTDDGGNRFESSNTWFLYNGTAGRVLAEGNTFSTTVKADIDARIYDRLDDASKGRVDFVPLAGGVIPTGVLAAPQLTLTGTSALQTADGAEIAFTLSAPADVTVTVLNLAGRPVATVATDRPAEAGLQRVVWNGRSALATRAPGGQYLVRVMARSRGGARASGLTGLSLEH